MFILIENGFVYDPEPRGIQSVLITNDRIEKVGAVNRAALDALDVECERIDATGCVVIPGLVDPHAHLLGGSGEGSLALATPMMFVHEIVRGAVTTVVGTLGVDTTMKTIAGGRVTRCLTMRALPGRPGAGARRSAAAASAPPGRRPRRGSRTGA